MLSRFLITLVSSWLANPLGVLVAQSLGVAKDPVLLMLLLGVGTATGFQLLLNEGLAAGFASGRFKATRNQLLSVLLIQATTTVVTLFSLADHGFGLLPSLILSIFLLISTALSYRTAVTYYRIVMSRLVSNAQAIRVGALPGVVTLVIFAGASAEAVGSGKMPHWLLSAALLPSLLQWWYVRKLDLTNTHKTDVTQAVPGNVFLIAALIALMALSSLITVLRDLIASYHTQFTALIIVGLNSLTSIANTLTRVAFLGKEKRALHLSLFVPVVVLVLAMASIWADLNTLSSLAGLLSVQCAIVLTIEAARRIPAKSVH